LLTELSAPSATYRLPVLDGQFLRSRGRLCSDRGELAEADHAYEQSVTILRTVGCPYALARALLDRGDTLAALGRPGEAAAALQEARGIFVDLRATPWLKRAEQALEPLVPA